MAIIDGGLKVQFPRMLKVRQKFREHKIVNIEEELKKQFANKGILNKVDPGMKIAIGLGSRGIANLDTIVKVAIEEIKKKGAYPFIVPAMGAHGGATAQGQKRILESYGFNESFLGVPICSSMQVIQLTSTPDGIPIYFDKIASQADGIVPINRVKIHTDFRGEIESGLLKMLAIGFGNQKGATTIHARGLDNFHRIIPEVGHIITKKLPILFGIACLEDAYENTAEVNILFPEKFFDVEKNMLERSKKIMAKINLPTIDVVIVDKMGKDISGDGIDPNIIGRFKNKNYHNNVYSPDIKVVIVLDITEKSQGNANGIGYADIIVKRLYDKIDFRETYANAFTSGVLDVAKIPIVMTNDIEALSLGVKVACRENQTDAKIVRIKNTLDILDIWISEPLYKSTKDSGIYTPLGNFMSLSFNSENCLEAFDI